MTNTSTNDQPKRTVNVASHEHLQLRRELKAAILVGTVGRLATVGLATGERVRLLEADRLGVVLHSQCKCR